MIITDANFKRSFTFGKPVSTKEALAPAGMVLARFNSVSKPYS